MKVRKFCLCGVKLEREVADEDQAREVVTMFRLEHTGNNHGPTDERGYRQVISRIINKNATARRVAKPMPVIDRIESSGDNHKWSNRFGLEVCEVCLLVKSAVVGTCKGAALILARDAVPVLVRKK